MIPVMRVKQFYLRLIGWVLAFFLFLGVRALAERGYGGVLGTAVVLSILAAIFIPIFVGVIRGIREANEKNAGVNRI
jgi:hypothetical protein